MVNNISIAFEENLVEENSLIKKENTDLDLLKKSVSVTKNKRFCEINIFNEYENNPLGQKTKTQVHTKIIKDSKYNSKEIHIKKVFLVGEENGSKKQDLIIREIFVDCVSDKRKVSDRKLSIKVDSNKSFQQNIGSLFSLENNVQPLLID